MNHPERTRSTILTLLAEASAQMTDWLELKGLRLSTVMRPLFVLEQAGLIATSKEHALNAAKFAAVSSTVVSLAALPV